MTIIFLILVIASLLVIIIHSVQSSKNLRAELQTAIDLNDIDFLKGFDAGYEDGYETGLRHKNLEWIAKPLPTKH